MDHFQKILETLKTDRPISDLSDNPVLNAVENFSQHASILKNKQARNSSDCFFIKLVIIDHSYMEIVALDALKATQRVDTPTKIIENNSKIFPIFFFSSKI